MHYHGVGLMADKDVDTVEDIRENIDFVLNDGGFRDNTLEMRAACRAYTEKKKLENTIDSLLNGPTR